MKNIFLVILILSFSATSYAIPELQVGAPDGSGWYVQNTASSSDPTENDTALTNGGTIILAAETKSPVTYVGGQYSTTDPNGATVTGVDWGSFSWNPQGAPVVGEPTNRSIFNGHGAILLASVPDGTGANAFSNLTVGGNSAFNWSADYSFFGDNHAPVKAEVSDFLFFDVGYFTNQGNVVPNFQDPNPSQTLFAGELKTLALAGMDDLSWIHFDLMAILSYLDEDQGTGPPSQRVVSYLIDSSYGDSPNSKDVTWKPGDDGGGGGGGGTPVPEPSTFILLGAGLVGLAVYRRKKQ